MPKILVLNGPNLNLLGTREPKHYGSLSLNKIIEDLTQLAKQDQISLQAHQSNAEHQLVDWIQQAPDTQVDFIIINPAAFTHTSVAIRDALAAVDIPFIEVHLSNVHKREPFRKHSYLSDLAVGVIAGLGAKGYEFAYRYAVNWFNQLDD
jgi:3-dehydroquinate dehydratase-2